ncbi:MULTISPECIES: hypothetical protein [Pantoea]|uniref:Transcriptional regulator n=2 Tax=Pantoea TaxID=53335 RepID=A0A0U3VD55_9GAMM|nr:MULTISPECIES: hypothetical protein [Pantoea]ALV92438.1 hypothetical protein LK04_09890 [Pantoea vagans]KHJ67980.1 hypothetical protein QU24_11220 [Pantoea rodasii]
MAKKTWSDKDLAYIERVAGKVPVHVMAAAINKSVSAVTSKAHSLGLKLKVPAIILSKYWPDYVQKNRTDEVS